MTPREHKLIDFRLSRQIKKAQKELTECGTLSEKLAAKEKVKELEAVRRKHRLNYYELIG